MKQYEIMTITNINLGEDGARDVSNKIKDLVTSMKGKVMDSDLWGKRSLAYEINKQTEGYYEIITFEIDSKKVNSIKQKLNLDDGLVRYLITAAE
jgi:small subunit ribosomal protein S6